MPRPYGWSVSFTVADRCIAMGLPRQLSLQWERMVWKWYSSCGPAWTVARLKSIKIDLLRILGGQKPIGYFRKNRKGRWYGLLGVFRRIALHSPRGFMIILNSLMVYSAFKPGQPTQAHVEALEQNVEAPAVTGSGYFPCPFRVDDMAYTEVKSIFEYEGSSVVKAPVYFGRPSVLQSESLELEFRWLKDPDNFRFFELYRNIYGRVFSGFPISYDRVASYGSAPPFPAMGSLVPLDKDGGWKIRWIASPYRCHQMALKPLGDRVYKLLRDLPFDYSTRADKGIALIQEKLRQGLTLYSVDLSSATDHFPLSIQLHILRQLNSSPAWLESVSLFEACSRGLWYWGRPGGSLRGYCWTKGQPMGLYPSFAVFSLAHAMVLYHFSEYRNKFCILGDDVVIWDAEVYAKYRLFLKKWEVPVSESKSLISSRLAEFAGKIITANKVFSGFKWKDLDDENFLEMMRQFGSRYARMLSVRQRAVYEHVKSLQPPVGCAHSVTDVVQSIIATPDTIRTRVGSRCMNFLRWCKTRASLLSTLSPFSATESGTVAQAFDKKVHDAVKGTPFEGISDPSIGAAYLGYHQRLADIPTLFVRGKRLTELQKYEQWLGLGKHCAPTLQTLNWLSLIRKMWHY